MTSEPPQADGCAVVLRRAKDAHLPAIAGLWMEMMEEHQAFEPRIRLSDTAFHAYQSYLMVHSRDEKSLLEIARSEKEVVGFCCSYICQNLPMFEPEQFGYISDLYVKPAYRHQGLGKRLLESAREFFRAWQLEFVQLQVYHHNAQGRVFWEKNGFQPVFHRLDFPL